MFSGNRLDTLVIAGSPHMCREVVKDISGMVRELKLRLIALAHDAPLVPVQSHSYEKDLVLPSARTQYIKHVPLDASRLEFPPGCI